MENSVPYDEIDYDNCLAFAPNLVPDPVIQQKLCRGEKVEGIDMDAALVLYKDALISNNVIKNVQYGIEITDYLCADTEKNPVIPGTIDGFIVKEIGDYAFSPAENFEEYRNLSLDGFESVEGERLTSVTIPNSVTMIGECAFFGNKLTNVTIPNSVIVINNYAFENNQLTSVVIPNSVISIGWAAFRGNQLASVTLSSSLTFITEYVFANNKLTTVTIPDGVTLIDLYAFSNNQLTSVTLGNGVQTIGDLSFENNKLTTVTIPNSVTSIGTSAFAVNELTSIEIPNSVTLLGSDAFESNPNLTTIIIHNAYMNLPDENDHWGATNATVTWTGN